MTESPPRSTYRVRLEAELPAAGRIANALDETAGPQALSVSYFDLGNGFFEDVYCTEPVYETQYHTETFEEPVYEDQPIYDTYYVFEIDTWSTIRTESASGTDFNLFWPAVDLNDEEREGDRQATYITVFQTSDGDTYEVEHSEDEWRQYAIGDEVTLEIDSFGNVTDVSPP